MLGDSVGRDEYIDEKHGRIHEIRLLASTWSRAVRSVKGPGNLFSVPVHNVNGQKAD